MKTDCRHGPKRSSRKCLADYSFLVRSNSLYSFPPTILFNLSELCIPTSNLVARLYSFYFPSLNDQRMVFGLIALAGTIPMTATSVLSLQSQAETTKSNGIDPEWKTEKCHIRCRPTARSPDDRKTLFQDNRVVLRNRKLYVQLQTYRGKPNHPFSGYYLPYPNSNFEGLVSTISDNPPQLNWIYLDTLSSIFQMSHGLRAEAENGLTGPWGARVCSDGEKRFLMENWEGFVAIENDDEPALWSLCFDRHDDGLKGRIRTGQRTVEVELIREAIEG